MAPNLPIRQIAYFVPDVRAAARQHHTLHGSGPFLVADHIPLRRSLHRGIERPLDHSSAYGQWGSVMVEFVQQNNPGPSAFHDLYPEGSGHGGIHHIAIFVNDLDATLASYARTGRETALYAEMRDGFAFAMVDTVVDFGHMTELYRPLPQLTAFYERVAEAARTFDGTDLIRPIAFT
jgi:hypothetical protein